MTKKRVINDDLILRISQVDEVVSKWMNENAIWEVCPEDCMPILVNKLVYNYDSKGRAHYFREDLRTLRDNNNLNVFNKLEVEQNIPGSKWYLKFKMND